jgi:signal transduction histidine kinase
MTAHLGPTEGRPPRSGAPATAELPGAAQALLDAVMAISSDLDLRAVLARIVESSTELTGARYGALGVVGADGHSLVDFVTLGLEPAAATTLAEGLANGIGLLAATADQSEVLRLDDLATHPSFDGYPADMPEVRTFLGAPIRIRGTLFGTLYLADKAGGTAFTDQDELLVQGLATAAGFVIENARAYGLSERRRQWLEAWAELADELQPPIELAEALQHLTRSVRTVSRALATAVVRFGPEGGRTISTERLEAGVVHKLLDSVLAEIDRVGASGDLVQLRVGDLAALAVPLRAHLAAPGVLVAVHDRFPYPTQAEERELLSSFAEQAALALDRVAAVSYREELAVTSDRERIARDLHDTVIQRLFATGLQLQATAMVTDRPEVADRLEQAVGDLDLTIRDIRGTIFELQHRHAGSLRGEIRSVVDEYAPMLGFTPLVRTSGPVDTVVTAAVRAQLVPVLRRAVSNVAQHASASTAEVDLAVSDDEVLLSVVDDGEGLESWTHPDRPDGGLDFARRQAEALGGSLELTPREPTGTSFVWRVPLA